jgi:hypothetical protein
MPEEAVKNQCGDSIATWTHYVVFRSPDDESDMNLQVVDPRLDTDDSEGEDKGERHEEEEEDSTSAALNELEPVMDDDEIEFEERVDEDVLEEKGVEGLD